MGMIVMRFCGLLHMLYQNHILNKNIFQNWVFQVLNTVISLLGYKEKETAFLKISSKISFRVNNVESQMYQNKYQFFHALKTSYMNKQ